MDLTQLEMFNAVAEAGSITQAAVYVSRLPGITFYAIANKFSR